MFQDKVEQGPYTLWFSFDDLTLKSRYRTDVQYRLASNDLVQGAQQVARCYLDVVSQSEGAVAKLGQAPSGPAWCALNWEAPGVLKGFELRHEATRLVPVSWVAQEVFWTVLDRRARGVDRRLFFEWMRVALLAVKADDADRDPFIQWFGGSAALRAVIKTTWERLGSVVKVRSGLLDKGTGQAPNGSEIEVCKGAVPDSFLLSGPHLAQRGVPGWGIDMLVWQSFRDGLLAAAEAAPPFDPPPPSPVAYRVRAACEIPGASRAVPLGVGALLQVTPRGAFYDGTFVNEACLNHLIQNQLVTPEYE